MPPDYSTPNEMKKPDVSTPSLVYQQMSQHWELPHTLIGGTEAMIGAAERFLPKEQRETQEAYNHRLGRSTLYPAFAKTIGDLSLKPFEKDISFTKPLPPELQPMLANVDGAGRSLSMFATDAMRQGLLDGLVYIYVDYPKLTEDIKTLADQREAKLAPYFVLIPAADVLEVRWHQEGDEIELDRVRIRECTREPDPKNEWAEVEVTRIRVFYPDHWDLYGQNDKNEWVILESGANSLNKIPLVAFYTKRIGNFEALPPLEELAFLNLKHWRSQSDQDNILHVARVPILFGRGFDLETDTIEVGATAAILTSNPAADAKYIEHTGKAVEAGQKDLDNLERKMAILGFEPLIILPVAPTATEVMTNEAESQSSIQAWISNLELALEQAFYLAAEWLGIALAEKSILVEIYREFGFSRNEVATLDFLFKLWQLNGLSQQTLWSEMKRRGLLSDNFEPRKELALIMAETGSITAGLDAPTSPDATHQIKRPTNITGAPNL